ncbi:MAG TPA: M81 family metallopeptidase, partial [Reyranella sp.]|nr:M81 family metallopeptidase [Reyranella sp.]
MAQKFVVAMMMHETNTFSPLPTPIESFSRAGALAGPSAIKESEGTNTSLGGFIEVARKAGAEFTVPMAASAHPSGLVTKAAYEQMTTAIVDEVKKGCDAVLLALHGAMVAEHYDDGEGELLNRIRKIAPDVPIAVALDFHTQMTDAMIKGASIITGYRTYPHIDMADTARRSGRTLMRMLAGEVEPKMVWGNRPIMSSSLVHTPSREPMKTLMGMANQAEDTGQVLNASVFGGFPQADIPHLALSSVIVCDKRTAEGEILLNKILDAAWEKREGFLFHPEPLSVQVARAKSLDGGPIVMADHGDNTASGGTQDVMSVIEEAMKQGLEDACAGPICDPGCVEQMIKAGVGAEVTLDLGGRTDMPSIGAKGEPLRLTGRVRRLSDGEFIVRGPMYTGSR